MCKMKWMSIIHNCCKDLSYDLSAQIQLDAQLFMECMDKPINKNGTTNAMFHSVAEIHECKNGVLNATENFS